MTDEFTFRKATKKQSYGRIALAGPAGSGKTFTALRLAMAMGQRVAVIDTEHRTASKYAHKFPFYTVQLENDFHPDRYVKAIQAAEAAGYEVLVIDSITHEWSGMNGCLELVDIQSKKMRSANKYMAWNVVTPLHNRFLEAMLGSRLHVIATIRSKMDYLQTEEDGKKVIKKMGLAPITRDGVEYEFDIVGDLDLDHNLVITKTRADELADTLWHKPGEELAAAIMAWLTTGEPPEPAPEPKQSKDAGRRRRSSKRSDSPPDPASHTEPTPEPAPADTADVAEAPTLTREEANQHFNRVYKRIQQHADPMDPGLLERCMAVSTNGRHLKQCDPLRVDAIAGVLATMQDAWEYGVGARDIESAFHAPVDHPDWTVEDIGFSTTAIRQLITPEEVS